MAGKPKSKKRESTMASKQQRRPDSGTRPLDSATYLNPGDTHVFETKKADENGANVSTTDLPAMVNNIICSSEFLDSLVDRLVEKVVTRLQESIDFNTKVIEDLKKELCIRDSKIKELQDNIAKVREESADETEQLHQYTRRNNVEIHGVPEIQGEDTYEILKDIGKAVGCEINKSDIDISHRMPTSNKSLPRPIIAKFTNRWKKQELMAAKKQVRQLQSSTIGINASSRPVYINDHLTPKSKGLLKRAKDLRLKGFKYVWTREGKIFVRKDDASPVINIRMIGDVAKLE